MSDFFDKPSKRKKFTLADEEEVWKKHEKDTEKDLKGKRTPGSGSRPHSKGDVSSDAYLTECKSTEKLSLSIKLAWLEKITREACNVGKIPLVSLRFDHAHFASKDWIMVPQEYFKELIEDAG